MSMCINEHCASKANAVEHRSTDPALDGAIHLVEAGSVHRFAQAWYSWAALRR